MSKGQELLCPRHTYCFVLAQLPLINEGVSWHTYGVSACAVHLPKDEDSWYTVELTQADSFIIVFISVAIIIPPDTPTNESQKKLHSVRLHAQLNMIEAII